MQISKFKNLNINDNFVFVEIGSYLGESLKLFGNEINKPRPFGTTREEDTTILETQTTLTAKINELEARKNLLLGLNNTKLDEQNNKVKKNKR